MEHSENDMKYWKLGNIQIRALYIDGQINPYIPFEMTAMKFGVEMPIAYWIADDMEKAYVLKIENAFFIAGMENCLELDNSRKIYEHMKMINDYLVLMAESRYEGMY